MAGAPSGFTYQWQRCDAAGTSCQPIAGAVGASYVLTYDDVGHTLRVLETASGAGGAGSPASSIASGIVTAPPPPPAVKPVNQTVPAITGTARVGQKLGASAGTWTGSPPIVFTYQWERCSPSCSTIHGAGSTAYTPTGADQGDRLAVIVTASNSAGSGQTVSAATGVVAAAGPTPERSTSAVAAALGVSGHAASIDAGPSKRPAGTRRRLQPPRRERSPSPGIRCRRARTCRRHGRRFSSRPHMWCSIARARRRCRSA